MRWSIPWCALPDESEDEHLDVVHGPEKESSRQAQEAGAGEDPITSGDQVPVPPEKKMHSGRRLRSKTCVNDADLTVVEPEDKALFTNAAKFDSFIGHCFY